MSSRGNDIWWVGYVELDLDLLSWEAIEIKSGEFCTEKRSGWRTWYVGVGVCLSRIRYLDFKHDLLGRHDLVNELLT